MATNTLGSVNYDAVHHKVWMAEAALSILSLWIQKVRW